MSEPDLAVLAQDVIDKAAAIVDAQTAYNAAVAKFNAAVAAILQPPPMQRRPTKPRGRKLAPSIGVV